MLKIKRSIIVMLIILLLSLIIGTIAIKAFSFISPTPEGDAAEFDQTAVTLANNGEFITTFHFIRAPGYAYFLATIYKLLGHNYTLIYYIQFLLLGLISVIIFQICHKFFKLNILFSFLPAIVVVFWPYFILHAKLLLSELLFSFLLILFIYLMLIFIENKHKKYLLLSGFILGLATLTRPITMLLPFWLLIIFLIYYFIKKQFSIKPEINIENKIIKPIVISIVIFFLTIIPWVVYISLKTGKFVPITSTFSTVYNGANKSFVNEWSYYHTPGYEPGAKVTFQKIMILKIKNFFRFWKSGANGYQAKELITKYPFAYYSILAYKIIFYLLLFFALLSNYYLFKNGKIFFLWSVLLYVWLVYTALHTQPRYNLPIIPIMIILAFYSLYNIKKIKLFCFNNNA